MPIRTSVADDAVDGFDLIHLLLVQTFLAPKSAAGVVEQTNLNTRYWSGREVITLDATTDRPKISEGLAVVLQLERKDDRTSATMLYGVCNIGSDAHWSQFLEKYEPMLLDWARQMGLGEQAAAEVLSDVYCKLLEHLPVFIYDPKRSFRGWLRRVQQNAVTDLKRRRIRKPMHFSTDLVSACAAPEQIEVDSQFSEALSQLVEQAQRVSQLVQSRVASKTWQAFTRTAIDGASPNDVAAELGMSLTSVYVARNRVLTKLRAFADVETGVDESKCVE
ncbi:MAG: sigma-70 family RNA polymerase sigma factor [Planctomycetales bacterium]|nr:sigma-70 family RNA polymerase sigma factor [Planctomycetales bacterium]